MATTITKTSRYIPKTSVGGSSSIFVSSTTNGAIPSDLSNYYVKTYIDGSLNLKAPIASPTFTGIATTPNLYTTGSGIPIRVTNNTYNEWVIQKRRTDESQKLGIREYGSNGGLALVTADVDRILIGQTGIVGVGSNPNSRDLAVSKSLNGNVVFENQNTNSGTSARSIILAIADNSGAALGMYTYGTSNTGSLYGITMTKGAALVFGANNTKSLISSPNDLLFATGGGLKLTLTSDGKLQTDYVGGTTSFVSGFNGAGYQLDNNSGDYTLEVDNLIVRKGMKVYELEINKLSSINGGMVISVANATTLSIHSVAPSTWFFYIDEDGTNKPIQFVADDYIRAQVWTGRNINSFLGKVLGVTHSATFGNAYITVLGLSGTPWDIMDLVQVGHASSSSRQNLIYMTASDTNNPYIDVIAGVNNGVFTNKTKARLGNLTGLRYNDASISGYGLWTDNAYLTGAVIANSGKIGGWVIDTSALIKDTGTAATSSGMAPLDYPFYAGSSYANRASAPFRVTPDGYLTSSLLINGYDSAGTDIIGKEDIPETYTNAVISSWTKIKELELGENIKGTVSIKVSFKVTFITGSNSYSARIYRNGNAVGTTRGPFNLNGTYTETIAGWTAGDLIQLYIYQPNYPGSGTIRFDNLRVLGTHSTALEEVTIVSGGDLMLQRNTLNNVKYETYSINASSYSVSAYAYSSFITTYTAGNCTITLPETSDLTIGQVFIFVNATTARTTILQTPGVEQFYDAGGTYDTRNIGNRQSLTIMWNGTAWSVIAYR